jgi:Tfp pilus assembly protein PilP
MRHPARQALVLAAAAAAWLAGAGSLPAAEEKAPAAPAPAATAPSGPDTGAIPTGGPEVKQAGETINRIMEDNEAMLAGRGFTYDPAGRRDPFRSLVDALNAIQKGPRPRGIAGMLISEVDLVGIVQKGKEAVAFFNGSDNKGYFLHVGDTLFDGKIIRIDRASGTVMFRQDVNDPRSIKPYRDVTKRLASAEEESL